MLRSLVGSEMCIRDRYNLQVVYKPGKFNVVPDALSRVEVPDSNPVSSPQFIGATSICLHNTPTDIDQYRRLQSEDTFWSAVIKYISSNILSDGLTPTQTNHLQKQKDNYILQNDILYYVKPDSYRPLLCVPTVLQHDLLTSYHSSLFGCHVGRSRTQARLSAKYFWLGMSSTCLLYTSPSPRDS